MKQYLDLVKKTLTTGVKKQDRTGTGTISIFGHMFEHDMAEGFPLLTTKHIPFRLISSELEFFLRGLCDKRWLQDRNNHIWDEWCDQKIVPYSHNPEAKQRMLEERDLGPIYGWQWRHFGAEYRGCYANYEGQGIDQIHRLVHSIKTNPNSRQMIVSAWNPEHKDRVVPPFCHYSFQVTTTGDRLNLLWNQRSVDTMLGLPFNIASYALLLHLLAQETGYKEGMLKGSLGDVHIYNNHLEGVEEQLSREPFDLCKVETGGSTGLINFPHFMNWEYTNSRVRDYKRGDRIKFNVAV